VRPCACAAAIGLYRLRGTEEPKGWFCAKLEQTANESQAIIAGRLGRVLMLGNLRVLASEGVLQDRNS